MNLELIENILIILTLIGTIYVVVYVLSLIFKKELKIKFISENSLLLAFLVALSAMVGSLFYSEILGYAPCTLCWYQRILIYPQVLLLGLAIWYKDYKISRYIVPMSVIGIIIGFYQYFLQRGIIGEIGPCSITGLSCSEQFILGFGFITIPFMSIITFGLLIIFSLMNRESKRKNSELK